MNATDLLASPAPAFDAPDFELLMTQLTPYRKGGYIASSRGPEGRLEISITALQMLTMRLERFAANPNLPPACIARMWEVLRREPWGIGTLQVYAALAANPNLPLEYWGLLAKDCAAQLVRNAALPLLALENPAWFRELPVQSQYRLLQYATEAGTDSALGGVPALWSFYQAIQHNNNWGLPQQLRLYPNGLVTGVWGLKGDPVQPLGCFRGVRVYDSPALFMVYQDAPGAPRTWPELLAASDQHLAEQLLAVSPQGGL